MLTRFFTRSALDVAPPAPESLHEVQRLEMQAQMKGWAAGIYDFGRARMEGVDYFNCGLVVPPFDPAAEYLIVRRSRWSRNDQMGINDLMAFRLENNRLIEGRKIQMEWRYEMEHFEDPRAYVLGGQLFISCCNFQRNRKGTHFPHQIIAEINRDWVSVQRYDPVYGNNGHDTWSNTKHEKNWLWFEDAGQYRFLLYQSQPLTIVPFHHDFKPVGPPPFVDNWSPTLWAYGAIRGGTPPVLVDGEYWTFFHSSYPWREGKRQYHMGALAFSAEEPFRVTRVTPAPLLSGSQYNRGGTTKLPCIFPCGARYQHGTWKIVGGSNDIDCFWALIPHRDICQRSLAIA